MITPPYVRTMAAYNAEVNRRWYAAADTLTDAQRREDRGAFFGSLHDTLSHIAWADQMWMSRFAAWPKPQAGLGGSRVFIEDFAELAAFRQRTDAAILQWAETVTQPWLDGEVAWFSGAMQRDMVQPAALLVVHMFNHQTHHRGQAHAILTSFGAKTGDTDLPFVL